MQLPTGGRYGRSGDIVWQLGNLLNHVAGRQNDQVHYRQHDAHILPRPAGKWGES